MRGFCDRMVPLVAVLLAFLLGMFTGRENTERKYRDVATCSACNGLGVVTTREAPANISAPAVERLRAARREAEQIREQIRTDRLLGESQSTEDAGE